MWQDTSVFARGLRVFAALDCLCCVSQQPSRLLSAHSLMSLEASCHLVVGACKRQADVMSSDWCHVMS